MQSTAFTLFYLLSASFATPNWSKTLNCNEFNPPSIKNVNLNEIQGIWYAIRVKHDSKVSERIARTEPIAEWIRDKDTAIVSSRLVQDLNMCVYNVLHFKPIPGTRRSEYEFISSQIFTKIQWRVLFRNAKYMLVWACFYREGKDCVDWASKLFSRSRSRVIPITVLKRLDRISYRATCKTISKYYETATPTKDCPRLVLPADKKYSRYYYY